MSCIQGNFTHTGHPDIWEATSFTGNSDLWALDATSFLSLTHFTRQDQVNMFPPPASTFPAIPFCTQLNHTAWHIQFVFLIAWHAKLEAWNGVLFDPVPARTPCTSRRTNKTREMDVSLLIIYMYMALFGPRDYCFETYCDFLCSGPQGWQRKKKTLGWAQHWCRNFAISGCAFDERKRRWDTAC